MRLSLAYLYFLPLLVITLLASCTENDPTLYQVTVSQQPAGVATITPSPDSSYESGTEISLRANPSQGYRFVSWSGDDSSSSNPYTFTVRENKSLIANFEMKTYQLTVNSEGEGTVSERVVAADSTYEHGTVVELNAEPNTGWEFVRWQGDLNGSDNPTQIIVDESKEVTAVFEIGSYPLNIKIKGEGSVSKDPDQSEYTYGTSVTLKASPNDGWRFDSWDGDASQSDNPITISTDSTITLTATFENKDFAGGIGTEDNPYRITNLAQLQNISDYIASHFIQVNDINASESSIWNKGKGFKPIGDDVVPFTGTFNGKNYKITGLTIDRSGEFYVGLFGYLGKEGQVKNANLENIEVTGNVRVGGLIGQHEGGEISNSTTSGNVTGSFRVGGLVGSSGERIIKSSSESTVEGEKEVGGLVGTNVHGAIESSYATGKVTGYVTVGGLVGFNHRGQVIQSFASGDVTASSDHVGGLVGDNLGDSITNSYALGNVTGSKQVGGLVGVNRDNGSIQTSFSSGSVSGGTDLGGLIGVNGATVQSSYWDTESSNQASGIGRGATNGIQGLTTPKMTGQSAEDNMNGFDFGNIWITTDSYPILRWQK